MATIQSLFDALDNVRRLWNVSATGPAPEDKQLATWMSQFTEAELMYAFQRVGVRFRHGYTEAELLYRYCTGVLVAEHKAAAQPKSSTTSEVA
jgi:hypothetical protein